MRMKYEMVKCAGCIMYLGERDLRGFPDNVPIIVYELRDIAVIHKVPTHLFIKDLELGSC